MRAQPTPLTDDQYDKLLSRIYDLELRLKGVEKQVTYDTCLDEIFREQRRTQKMLIKIGTRIFKKGIQ